MIPRVPTVVLEIPEPENEITHKLRVPVALADQYKAGNTAPALDYARAKAGPLLEARRKMQETVERLKRGGN